MTTIPKLRHEHFRLMATVRRLGAMIERTTPPPALHLRALHHELGVTLNAHLEAEDMVDARPAGMVAPEPVLDRFSAAIADRTRYEQLGLDPFPRPAASTAPRIPFVEHLITA